MYVPRPHRAVGGPDVVGALGADAVLAKPFQPQELLDRVDGLAG